MTAPTLLVRGGADEPQFLDAGSEFDSRFSKTLEYSGLVHTGFFDCASYLAEFDKRNRQLPPVGAYKFHDVDVTGAWMFLSKRNHERIYSSLPGMGWSREHIDYFMANEIPQMARERPDQVRTLTGRYVLLSCPGAFTFGHVLVDISLRIQLAKAMGLFAGAKILIQSPVHSWYRPFLSIAGVSIDDCVTISRGEQYRVEEVYVPTWTGINGVQNQRVARYGFTRMKEVLNSILGPKPKERKMIFPLHTTMSSIHHPRGVVERDFIADKLYSRFGIESFDPLSLSFAGQVAKFREARLVLGEDSSALHNVLWSDAADLVVMAPANYFNYYHIGIQAINGGRTAIMWGDLRDEKSGSFEIDLDGLCRTLDQLVRRESSQMAE